MAASTVGLKSIQANPSKPQPNEDHDEKNKRLRRPISPHLGIYQFQSNMALSITHRFTGLAQTGLLYGLAIGNEIVGTIIFMQKSLLIVA